MNTDLTENEKNLLEELEIIPEYPEDFEIKNVKKNKK